MASTQPLSYRLKVMEARLNCMTDTIEQLRGRIHNLDVAVSNSVAIQTRFLSMLEQLQPLANFLAPLSNVPNPRTSSADDSGMGDMSAGATEEGEDNVTRTSTDTRSPSCQPSQLRRRRGRSNLKANINTSVSSEEDEAQVDSDSGFITVVMQQDVQDVISQKAK